VQGKNLYTLHLKLYANILFSDSEADMKLEGRHEGNVLVTAVLDKRLDAGAVDDFKTKMAQYIADVP